MFSNEKSKYWLTAGAVGLTIAVMIKYRKRISSLVNKACNKDILSKQRIEVINSAIQCKDAVKMLYRECEQLKVLGFDCEWVTSSGLRHPIALLQLTSPDGYCALFRLCQMKHVPTELKEILESDEILKVGVAPFDDAHKLLKDYSVCVNGTLDLRHLAVLANEQPEGLSAMSARQLNIKLDKDWRLRCSNWEMKELNEKQIKYAATDSFVAVEIFDKLIKMLMKGKRLSSRLVWDDVRRECKPFVNMRFKQKSFNNLSKGVSSQIPFEKLISKQQKRSMYLPNFKQPKRGFVTRSKPLYENCYMLNPEGQILSTCDVKKAKWYLEKNLATFISDNPLTIRLNFKPSGDVSGDVDKYYQIPRENKCVVCGHEDSYIRKNVIPREYRKLFPVIMKSHSSHDVLLLCNNCHQISNARDLVLRNKLNIQCDAPLDSKNAVIVHRNLQKVASAAKALLESSVVHNIPTQRREELERIVKEYYACEDLTEETLRCALRLKYVKENPLYESHGKKVVEHFSVIPGGLLQLEEMWRQHFLDTMSPKHMPELWSVQHNKERLEIRAVEGRLKEEDMLLSGFASLCDKRDIDPEPLKSL